MDAIGVVEAKKRFGALLDRIERGNEIVITRRGKPIARLMPIETLDRGQAALEALCNLRKTIAARTGRMTSDEIIAMRDEGRR